MEIIVNGKKHKYSESFTIKELLKKIEKINLPLAVRLNDETVPRKRYMNTKLKDGDKLSVIVFLGGG